MKVNTISCVYLLFILIDVAIKIFVPAIKQMGAYLLVFSITFPLALIISHFMKGKLGSYASYYIIFLVPYIISLVTSSFFKTNLANIGTGIFIANAILLQIWTIYIDKYNHKELNFIGSMSIHILTYFVALVLIIVLASENTNAIGGGMLLFLGLVVQLLCNAQADIRSSQVDFVKGEHVHK